MNASRVFDTPSMIREAVYAAVVFAVVAVLQGVANLPENPDKAWAIALVAAVARAAAAGALVLVLPVFKAMASRAWDEDEDEVEG